MKYPQHHQTLTIESILKHVSRAQNLQYDLAVFLSTGDWSPQSRVVNQDLYLGNNFSGDDRGKRRMLPIEKFNEAIEVGESLVRPFQLHLLRQFRNAGVPQV